MLYFAYGSNMDWTRMKERCPSAKFISTAKLTNYKFAITHRCMAGTGVSDIVRSEGSEVWGVVYQIDELDIGNLDRAEGYRPGREKNSYKRIEMHVDKDGDSKQPLDVFTYVVTGKENDVPNPSLEYKKHIVDGARYWKLPEQYIVAVLERIEVSK